MATIKVKTTHLRIEFFVRISTNQDRIEQFAERYISEGITALPLIQVYRDPDHQDIFVIADGRTRYEAIQMVNTMEPGFFTEIEVELLAAMPPIGYHFLAMLANAEGAMPMSTSDIHKSVTELMLKGVSRQKIISELGKSFGNTVIQKACNFAQSNIAKINVNKALQAIDNSEMTLAQAAEKYGVNPETLKSRAAGENMKQARESGTIKAHLQKLYKRQGLTVGQQLSKLAKDISDGVTEPKEMAEVLKFVEQQVRKQEAQLQSWRERAYGAGVGEEVNKPKRKVANA